MKTTTLILTIAACLVLQYFHTPSAAPAAPAFQAGSIAGNMQAWNAGTDALQKEFEK